MVEDRSIEHSTGDTAVNSSAACLCRVQLAGAENLRERAKSSCDELATATGEQFEELRESTIEHWEALSRRMDAGWTNISEKLRNIFS